MTPPALIERITRSLAYMLRHQPERFDLELDEYGFGAVEDVVRALNEALGERVDVEDLENAIASGDRPRYEIDKGRIRALYGHSIEVRAGEPSKPPERLYVGVQSRDAERALRNGLRSGRRRLLHLALDEEEGRELGRRAGEEYAVMSIAALDAWEEGINFYDRQSLFLAEEIPTEFLTIIGRYTDGYARPEFEESRHHGGHSGRERGGRGRRPDRARFSGREERRPDERRPDEHRPDDRRTDEHRPDDRRTDEHRPDDRRTDDRHAEDPRPEEARVDPEDEGNREPRRGQGEESRRRSRGPGRRGRSREHAGEGRSREHGRDPGRERMDEDRSRTQSGTGREGRSRSDRFSPRPGSEPARNSSRPFERAAPPRPQREPAPVPDEEPGAAFGLGVFENEAPKPPKPVERAPRSKESKPRDEGSSIRRVDSPEEGFGAGL